MQVTSQADLKRRIRLSLITRSVPWDPTKHDRGPGGRFKTMLGKVREALRENMHDPHGDPLSHFTRPQLRKAAEQAGIELKHGAPIEDIKKALRREPHNVPHGPNRPTEAHVAPAPTRDVAKKAAPRAPRKAAAKAEPKPPPPNNGPQTGKDLLKDTSAKKLGAKVVEDAKAYEGPDIFDPQMSAIAHMQGFDGLPQVVSAEEMDRLFANGSIRLERAVNPAASNTGKTTKTAHEIQEQFRYGQARFGLGWAGNGYYFGVGDSGAASLYGSGEKGSTIRATLAPDAKVINFDDLVREWKAYGQSQGWDVSQTDNYLARTLPPDEAALANFGHFAAARGYDAIRSADNELVLLNRSKAIVEKAPEGAAVKLGKLTPSQAADHLRDMLPDHRAAFFNGQKFTKAQLAQIADEMGVQLPPWAKTAKDIQGQIEIASVSHLPRPVPKTSPQTTRSEFEDDDDTLVRSAMMPGPMDSHMDDPDDSELESHLQDLLAGLPEEDLDELSALAAAMHEEADEPNDGDGDE